MFIQEYYHDMSIFNIVYIHNIKHTQYISLNNKSF